MDIGVSFLLSALVGGIIFALFEWRRMRYKEREQKEQMERHFQAKVAQRRGEFLERMGKRIQVVSFVLAVLLLTGSAWAAEAPSAAVFAGSSQTYQPDLTYFGTPAILASDITHITVVYDTRQHLDPNQRVKIQLQWFNGSEWQNDSAASRDGGPNLNKIGEPISSAGLTRPVNGHLRGATIRTAITVTAKPGSVVGLPVGPIISSTAIVGEARR